MFNTSRKNEVKNEKYCVHVNEKVTLNTTYVYPADILPETPARITNRNCSHFFDCTLQDKTACVFAVSEPRTAVPVDFM